jgi:hypothetical protein
MGKRDIFTIPIGAANWEEKKAKRTFFLGLASLLHPT